MEFPKMLYKGGKVLEQKLLEAALRAEDITMEIVHSAEEEAEKLADGFVADVASLLRKKPGPKPADETI